MNDRELMAEKVVAARKEIGWPFAQYEVIDLLLSVLEEEREGCAQDCDSVNADCNRESRHEPAMLRNGAGAAMCASKIRARGDE